MVSWEQRGGAVHTILIPIVSKDSRGEFAALGERLKYRRCLLLEVNASLLERGDSFILKGGGGGGGLLEDDLRFISKCHFENPLKFRSASHENNMKERLKKGPLVE